MKKYVLVCIAALIAFAAFSPAKAQMTFGVGAGIDLTGATFGYKFGNFTPFVGLQYIGFSGTYEHSYKEYNYDVHQVVDVTKKDDASIGIIMPSLGLKYDIFNNNKTSSYLIASVSKPFFWGFGNELNSTSIFAAQVGFGAEYYFDKKFSIAGEFGLRGIFGSTNEEIKSEVYNPNTQSEVPYIEVKDYNLNLSMIYTRISLNFYFGE
jgi:hypothetical protein